MILLGFGDFFVSFWNIVFYKGQNLTLLYTNGKKAMTDLQDSSNIMMKATMKVANDYLKKNLNLTMKDLGFTAYK